MEDEVSRRKLVHTLGVFAAIAACTRGTNLFQFFTRPKTSTQDGARVLEVKPFTRSEWEVLARSYDELEKRITSQHLRLVRRRIGVSEEQDRRDEAEKPPSGDT